MTIDLQRFCASELDVREYIRAPWLVGEWVYATNGCLAVRVPAKSCPNITETPKGAPDAASLFARAFDGTGDFLLMPPVPAVPKCFECDGTGKVRAIKCPDCEDGHFTRGDWTYECQNCAESPAGLGWQHLPDDEYGPQPHEVQRPCHECEGRGFLILQSTPSIKIGEAGYHPSYLAMLAALPQIRIRPGDPAERDGKHVEKPNPAALIFDGGQALLMPRRD